MARFMRWFKSWVCRVPVSEHEHSVVLAPPGAKMATSFTIPHAFNWQSQRLMRIEDTKECHELEPEPASEQWHVGWH